MNAEVDVNDEPTIVAEAADPKRGVVVGILISVLIALVVYFYWHLAR